MYVYECQLRTKYGLTSRLIRLLGEPDSHGPNSHNPRGWTNLYLIGRVESFAREHEAEIKAAAARKEKRRSQYGD